MTCCRAMSVPRRASLSFGYTRVERRAHCTPRASQKRHECVQGSARRRQKKAERTIFPKTMASSSQFVRRLRGCCFSSLSRSLQLPQARVQSSTPPSHALRVPRGQAGEKQNRAGAQGRDNGGEGRFFSVAAVFRWRAAKARQAEKKKNKESRRQVLTVPCLARPPRRDRCCTCHAVLELLREGPEERCKKHTKRETTGRAFFFFDALSLELFCCDSSESFFKPPRSLPPTFSLPSSRHSKDKTFRFSLLSLYREWRTRTRQRRRRSLPCSRGCWPT